MHLYLASSWRNPHQPAVVDRLRRLGHEVYDFRRPEPDVPGFRWDQISLDWPGWSIDDLRRAINDPLATAGFGRDVDAMHRAEACILLLPAGRSAHLEAGWCVGKGKPLHILSVGRMEPELMYRFADVVLACDTHDELLCSLDRFMSRVQI